MHGGSGARRVGVAVRGEARSASRMAWPCPQCSAGADALLEDDGQLVLIDCGTVVGGLLINEAAFGEHADANMPSYHSQQ